MLFDRGFATLANVKNRLGISDTTDDTILNEIIRSTAAAIENVAGRALRRRHGRTEILSGGNRTLRLSVSPITVIHCIRESTSRDFDNSDNYTELVEGTDFILEAAEGARPGNTGVIRRLNRNWLGNDLDRSGQIQVFYTAGYKTDDEVLLENTTTTIQSAPLIFDYSIRQSTDATPVYTALQLEEDPIAFGRSAFGVLTRSFVRFDLSELVFPIWTVLELQFFINASATSDTDFETWVLSLDASGGNLSSIYLDMDSSGSALQLDVDVTAESGGGLHTFTYTDSADVVGIESLMQRAFSLGQLSVGLKLDDESIVSGVSLTSSETGSSILIPKLSVSHRSLPGDFDTVPGDLRHANVLQASYEFQQRKTVGILSSSQRGVAIASGASVSKDAIDVLPEVVRIARRYRRLY